MTQQGTGRSTRPSSDDVGGGFTLIEVLVVVTILGILAAVVVFVTTGITDRGHGAACETDAKTVEIASEAYFATHHAYAPDVQTLVDEGLLREAPTTDRGWQVDYDPTTGSTTCQVT